MFLHFEYPGGAYWYSSARWQAKTTWLALQGPGRVAVKSVYERPEHTGYVYQHSGATQMSWNSGPTQGFGSPWGGQVARGFIAGGLGGILGSAISSMFDDS
jgi:hypothetical protein